MEAAVAAVRGCAAAQARREGATRTAYRLLLEVEALRAEGVTSHQGIARALMDRGVPTPRGGAFWTHTTAARLLTRVTGQGNFPVRHPSESRTAHEASSNAAWA